MLVCAISMGVMKRIDSPSWQSHVTLGLWDMVKGFLIKAEVSLVLNRDTSKNLFYPTCLSYTEKSAPICCVPTTSRDRLELIHIDIIRLNVPPSLTKKKHELRIED